ncbi:MAG: ParB N-terminal domain-containing protein [Acidobacteria bacterium]|nr:ParB N-terminal domain-containing protein [Acidobacteriota bacterium]
MLLVARELIVANLYNPNSVSPDKLDLLRQSILDNGFCFPIVTIWDDEVERFIIIDGFHRDTMGDPDWLDLDYIPLVLLKHDITRRMTATVQFNKARGVHQVDLDADVIRALIEQGMSEDAIAVHLGIDLETIHRYKQLTGVAELFKNASYSMSWDVVEVGDQ